MNQEELMLRIVDALDNAAAELERLVLLREYELGVRVVYNHDPNVVSVQTGEE
jgi:hypothetical protein